MSLQKYPYDRHVIPFCLATRATKDADGILTKWKLSKKCPGWAPNKYHEDKAMISQTQTTPDLEFNHKQCFAYLEGKKAILCVLIERPPKNLMKRVALPVCIVVSIAISVSGLEESTYGGEYTAAVTSLLTLTAFWYTVQSSLPKLPYLTWVDCYFLVRTPAILRPPKPNRTKQHPQLPSESLINPNPCHGSLASSSTSSSSSRSSLHRECASIPTRQVPINSTDPSTYPTRWATQRARNVTTA